MAEKESDLPAVVCESRGSVTSARTSAGVHCAADTSEWRAGGYGPEEPAAVEETIDPGRDALAPHPDSSPLQASWSDLAAEPSVDPAEQSLCRHQDQDDRDDLEEVAERGSAGGHECHHL
jgi:hypothetical protein